MDRLKKFTVILAICMVASFVFSAFIYRKLNHGGFYTSAFVTFDNNYNQLIVTKIEKKQTSNLSPSSNEARRNLTQDERFIQRVEMHWAKLPQDSVYRTALKMVIERVRTRTSTWKYQEKQSILDTQFLDYMRCPTSLRKTLLRDPFARGKFVPETPILAWDKHYSDEEYMRLSKYHRVNGWRDMKQLYVFTALAALNSSHNQYLFDDRTRKDGGFSDRDRQCVRCAVVGNGGILNGSNVGDEIDLHDYVFRVNTALTEGHEEDVGYRTSFYCFGMVTLANSLRHGWMTGFKYPPSDEGLRYVFVADRQSAYSYIAAVLNGQRPPLNGEGLAVRFQRSLQAADIKLIHPDFERYLKWSWVNSTDQYKTYHRPTTGGIMLLLALHTCDEVSVYGFGENGENYTEYYYDKTFKKRRSIPHHDNESENMLWKELHRRGIITLYTRD